MIGLDTNVLVRILTGDDEAQTRRAKQFLARTCSAATPAFVGSVVLAETVWVLESVYGFERDRIGDALDAIFSAEEIRLEDETSARAAWQAVVQDGADFADALIAAIHAAKGCETTVTFDRKAAKLKGFKLLG